MCSKSCWTSADSVNVLIKKSRLILSLTVLERSQRRSGTRAGFCAAALRAGISLSSPTTMITIESTEKEA